MSRDNPFGIGPPRFMHLGTGLDFTPDKYVNLSVNELVDHNIKRKSIITNESKVIAKGQNIRNKYLIQDLTLAEINAFLVLHGETIGYYPNTDFNKGHIALVENIEIDDYDVKKVDLIITLITRDYETMSEWNVIFALSGFVRPDGVNDFVYIPITTLGDEFSIAFKYKNWAYGSSNYIMFTSSNSYVEIKNDYTSNRLTFRSGAVNSQQRVKSSNDMLTYNSSDWHSVVITGKISTQDFNMYFDGVLDTGGSTYITPLTNETYTHLQLFGDATNYVNCDLKDFVITTDIMSQTDVDNYETGDIDSISDMKPWYKCDDASGNLVDSSGSGIDGVPTNTDSTFYNYPIPSSVDAGETHNILWNTVNVTGTVTLELWKAGAKLQDIATGQTNSGSYSWTVPSALTYGSDYQIKIIADDYFGLLTDITDAFSIGSGEEWINEDGEEITNEDGQTIGVII